MARLILGLLLVTIGASATGAAEGDATPLTLERVITRNEFRSDSFGPARWLTDGSGYTTLEKAEASQGRDIVKYDPETGARSILVASAKLKPEGVNEPLEINDYSWSVDGNALLIFTNTRRVWRLNTRGDYWLYDLKAGFLKKLGGEGPEASMMFAKLCPDGGRVAFVRENNLYVEDLRSHQITQLTNDGEPTRINGTFDWVYEEEFSIRDGFRWSPDGASIAYWQIDTTGMQEYKLVDTTASLYPKLTSIRYPKVGQTNPACRIGVVASSGGPTRWIEVPGDSRQHYIPRMDWAANSKELVLQQLNRLQNTNQLMIADTSTGQAKTILTDRDDAWVEVVDDLHWINQGTRFTWVSERDGWRHLYLGSRAGGEPQLVTNTKYDIIDIVYVNEKANEVTFIASPDDPKSRYLFRGALDGSSPPRRLTPTDQPGTHQYQISTDGHWAFHTYSTFERPPIVELIRLPDHQVIKTLVDQKPLMEKIEALKLPRSEFFRVTVAPGVELDGWCLKPPGFDPTKRYPLLVHVYGEPAGQTVLDQWGDRNYLWHRMLTQHGFVVVSIDNRGTPAPRGRAWRKSIYRQIGILASSDQAEALRVLEARWPFIDPARVGIWGWSGGGSMSLNAIFRYPDLYQTAVAVAFISDQKLYDTIYQERYMGLPDQNETGFRDGSPITFADRLKGNLLLIHGTGDDNCHYQSCERLIDALVGANKPFSMLAYPNRTHGISEGANTSRHLYESMTRFLDQNLKPGEH